MTHVIIKAQNRESSGDFRFIYISGEIVMKNLFLFLSLFLLPSIVLAQAEPASESGVNATTDAVEALLPVLEDLAENTAGRQHVTPDECLPNGQTGIRLVLSGQFFSYQNPASVPNTTAWYSRDEIRKISGDSADRIFIELNGGQDILVADHTSPEDAQACKAILVTFL